MSDQTTSPVAEPQQAAPVPVYRESWLERRRRRRHEKPLTAWHYRLGWLLALVSFLFNIGLILALLGLRATVGPVVQETNQQLFTALESLKPENFEPYLMPFAIQQTLSMEGAEDVWVNQTIDVSQTLTVQLNETVPFRDTIQVNVDESIRIVDTLQVPLPSIAPAVDNLLAALGITELEVPINMAVPLKLTLDVPVDTEVSVNTEVEVPVRMTVPIEMPIEMINENLEPITIELDLSDVIPVPMNEMMEDIYMVQSLQGLYDTLRVLERLMFIPGQ